jgi:hypothetical protein
LAHRALAAIEQHEAVCVANSRLATEWRAAASESLARIEASFRSRSKEVGDAVDGLYGRMWWFGGSLAGGMFAIILLLVGVLVRK